MSDQLEKLLALEPTKKQAKLWRNWWEAPFDGEGTDQGTGQDATFSKGDIICGGRAFPSKDIAETYAESLHTAMIYLGAFPEGERP